MSFLRAILTCSFSRVSKSEEILRKIPLHQRNISFPGRYKNTIDTLGVTEVFDFPVKTFRTMPNDILKKLFCDTNSAFQNRFSYSKLIEHYLIFNIDFDLKELIKEMNQRNVEMNSHMCLSVIRKCSLDGDVDTILTIKDLMSKKNIFLSNTMQRYHYLAFVRAAKEDEASEFAKANELDEISPYILHERAKAYAKQNSIDKLEAMLKLIGSKEEHSRFILAIYEEAASTGMKDDVLVKILRYSKYYQFDLMKSIANLNRKGHFKQSLPLVTEFHKLYISANPVLKENVFDGYAREIILSFQNTACPIDIYRDMLGCVMDIAQPRSMNVFYLLSFDESLDLCKSLNESVNPLYLFRQLGQKLIDEYTVDNFEILIQFGNDTVDQKVINTFLMIMFDKLVAVDTNDVDAFITKHLSHKGMIVPVAMIRALCNGDITGFHDLQTRHSVDTSKFWFYNRYISHIISRNLNEEIETIFTEFASTFPHLIKSLQIETVFKKLNSACFNDDVETIKDTVKLAEKLQVKFDWKKMELLAKDFGKYEHIYRHLEMM